MLTQQRENLRFALLIIVPTVAFLLTMVLYPLIYSIWLSLHSVKQFGGVRFKFVGFDNYVDVYSDPKFWSSTLVTFRFVAESTILAIVIGVGFALILSNIKRHKVLIRTLVILPWGVSLYATGILFGRMLRDRTGVITSVSNLFGVDYAPDLFGAISAVEMTALAQAWNISPLVAFFVLTNIETIPPQLYNLAKIDKLTRWQTFRYVTYPQIRFTVFVLASVVIIFSFKAYDLIAIMTNGGPARATQTLPLELIEVSFIKRKLGYGAAMSVYLLVMIVGSTLLMYAVWGRKVDK